MKHKKVPSRFTLARRGYLVEEVESFISQQQELQNKALEEQRLRIVSLQMELDEKCKQYDAIKGREEQISKTLMSATKSAQDMQAELKKRYCEEIERLGLFRAKWLNAYDELKQRYHFDKDALNMENVVVSTRIELQKMLSKDFGIGKGEGEDEMERYFKQEVERLMSQQVEEQSRGAKNTKKEQPSAETAAGFDFEEALNPTESLEEICQFFGLGTPKAS